MKPYILIRSPRRIACFPVEVSVGSNHPPGNIRRKMSDLSHLASKLPSATLVKMASFTQPRRGGIGSHFPDRDDPLQRLQSTPSTEPALSLKIKPSLLGKPADRLKFTSKPRVGDIKKPKPLYPGGSIYIAPSSDGFLFPK
jgi:hypothetical protein